MWVLHSQPKKPMKNLEDLWKYCGGENIIKCNMKYSVVNIIACLNKRYIYLLTFIFFAWLTQQNVDL
jgi:hypothetical protein